MSNKPSASISELIFSGGDKFLIGKNEKIILVGPNNSGKSESLRELLRVCGDGKTERNLVVKGLKITKEGTAEELKSFLEENADYVGAYYRYMNWQIHENHINTWSREFLQNDLVGGFVKNIDANNRLNICNRQNSIAPGEQKSMPQHTLYDDEALMKKISDLFRKAFGKDLMFDFRGGSQLPIHVGDLSDLEGLIDRVGDEYVQSVRKNPLLDKQGDGMKSYAGILFEAIVSDLNITLIDEPEAFLHPPQMRRLGETLSSEVTGQLVVSTHSSDILRGFLEGTRGNIRILRISREGNKNLVSEASPSVIKELWEKPDLRYSNALEGIFHEQSIICEDDSDCRLINSIADYVASESQEQWQDTAYIPTGGKHGIPKIASVLREIGVPVKAVFDIDFLSERSLVKKTVDAFGGDWNLMEPIWTRVDLAVRRGIKPKSITEIKTNVSSIIEKAKDEELPKGDIIEAMKQGNPWNEVKRFGSIAIPNGESQSDYNTLKELLEAIGIYLIPVGEVENFCPDMGCHGPKFVTKLLSTVPLDDGRLTELRKFVEHVHRGDQ